MKKTIIMIFFLFFSITFIYATELWNGFSDNMTQEDVQARLMLLDNETIITSKTGKLTPYREWSSILVNDWPKGAFVQIEASSKQIHKVIFYFYENFLFHIKLNYTISNEDIFYHLKEQYGSPKKSYKSAALGLAVTGNPFALYDLFTEKGGYSWNLKEKTVRFFYSEGSGNDVDYYIPQVYEKIKKQQEAEEKLRQQEAERQRQEAEQNRLNNQKQNMTF